MTKRGGGHASGFTGGFISGSRSNMQAGVILALRARMTPELMPAAPPNAASDAFLPRATRLLAAYNRWRFDPGFERSDDGAEARDEEWSLRELEHDFLEGELRLVRERAATAPKEADAFVRWFEGLEVDGPGQRDPLFEWLATSASKSAMTWFLTQEVAGEAGFEDLVALTQVKMPERAKLELARNYWDEMGQGHAAGMHGPMLGRLALELGVSSRGVEIVWESLALSNLMIALATERRHAFRSVGALGVIELTAPGRARLVNAGLKRLGLDGEARRYYALHATLDVKHSVAWNREVIYPLVASNPSLARPLAEGALARLVAGKRCFDRYRSFLQPRAATRNPS